MAQVQKYLRFCPRCSNLLYLEEKTKKSKNRFICQTCPYQFQVKRKIACTYYIERDDNADDDSDEDVIIDEEKQNEHRQKTQVICPNCSHEEAYFYQMQTRSADEPMTNFYQCCKESCKHNWRD